MNQPTGIEALVCADIAARQKLGIAKYGRTVAESSDDMLQHAYEESLDLPIYLKAEIERRKKAAACLILTDPALLTRPSHEWAKETGVIVMDHGGWRGKTYDEAITKDEFLRRCCRSRCQWPRKILDAVLQGSLDETQAAVPT